MYMFFIYICSHNLKHGERRQKSRLKAEYFNVVYSYCVPMCLRITANIETLQCILNLYYNVSNFIFYIFYVEIVELHFAVRKCINSVT